MWFGNLPTSTGERGGVLLTLRSLQELFFSLGDLSDNSPSLALRNWLLFMGFRLIPVLSLGVYI